MKIDISVIFPMVKEIKHIGNAFVAFNASKIAYTEILVFINQLITFKPAGLKRLRRVFALWIYAEMTGRRIGLVILKYIVNEKLARIFQKLCIACHFKVLRVIDRIEI